MKDLIVRKEKVTRIRQQLNELSKVYDKSVEDYKNITLKQLRVPLLIYTGKILQDYQNGLGVFVSKDEMRFVSNGDAKHDILNTFSSGQLSGFVLAFLFAMNKQYIKASSDDIGFILIDDPVQTMDDINISSLIEVLQLRILSMKERYYYGYMYRQRLLWKSVETGYMTEMKMVIWILLIRRFSYRICTTERALHMRNIRFSHM